MATPVPVVDLARWRECRDCGLLQRLPEVPEGEVAICARCDALLRRVSRHALVFARVSVVCASILLTLAFVLPLVRLSILGRTVTSTVFSGPAALHHHGLTVLAVAVLATLVVVPAAKLLLELVVLFGVASKRPPRGLPWLFGWLEHVSPWAMVEVFLLGGFVAYSRLEALAHVHLGLAAAALGGAMLALVAIDATLDRESIWLALEAKTADRDRPRAPSSTSSRLIGCQECRRVERADEGASCSRCGHRLGARRGGLAQVWALLLAAALLYIPANLLPVMTVTRLGRSGSTTILNGVVELARSHLWPLALLVLLASVVIPISKLVSLGAMLVMTGRRSASLLRGRTRLFRVVKFVGRWSMIDIFMLSILVGVVHLGALATILPGPGAAAFCAVVILTMIATEIFDPRLMWDAGGRAEVGVEEGGAAHAGA